MSGLPPPPLRRHQRESLDALTTAYADGRRRAWVELPPGAGKTRVGLECARELLSAGRITRVVVFGPNTAIQSQWLAQAEDLTLQASVNRSLSAELTALTYQSLAVFDPESDDGGESELTRLHANGQALLQSLADVGTVLVILDECHHLLEVWGRLLDEVLAQLPDALVLGLTATPPEALTREQATLVDSLFGSIVYATTVPAVVKEGDLAPFAELVWLTTPTPTEVDWLAEERQRFTELIAELSDHRRGRIGFLPWLTQVYVDPESSSTSLRPGASSTDPEFTDALLRLHHAGLIGVPMDGRLDERHQHPPTVRDWGLLISDWSQHCLRGSDDVRDTAALEWLKSALPAVGLRLTRHGVRPGRSITDRVLARSQAKTQACVAIAAAEAANLGTDLRLLVLCDHESASSTVAIAPTAAPGSAGSARGALLALLADPATAALSPLLVTGRSIAGSTRSLARLRTSLPPALAETLELRRAEDGLWELVGRWTPSRWVPAATEFLTRGECRLVVGTRALLGEGWDAPCLTSLIDLTTATSLASVTQLRGRALRIDPSRPDKVALTWTVTCVAPDAPNGGNDWDRLVRKTSGFFGLDADGVISDGVSSIDPGFSPYAPPDAESFEASNARMLARGEDRPAIAAKWRVGEPYADRPARVVRIRPRSTVRRSARQVALGAATAPPAVVVGTRGWQLRDQRAPRIREWALWGLVALLAGAAVLAGSPLAAALLTGAAGGLLVGSLFSLAQSGRSILTAAARPPGLGQYAWAIADALIAADLINSKARVVIERQGGDYRCHLSGASEPESALFADALDELLAPLASPRYLISRYVATRTRGTGLLLKAGLGRARPQDEIWHQVPTVLATNANRAGAFATAWRHWVGVGNLLYAGSPEGAGVLTAQHGADPCDVTCVIRRQWT